MLTLVAGTLAVVAAVTGCGSDASTSTSDASVAGVVAPPPTEPRSDPTRSSTTGSPAATTDPTPPPTLSVDLTASTLAVSSPPTTHAPRSFPMPEPHADEYEGSAQIIETNGQAHLAFVINFSNPPQVFFGIPLIGWDWGQVDGEITSGATVWTDAPYSVVGAWDGTRLTLTQPPQPATDDDPHLPDGSDAPTPGCDLADAQSAVGSDAAVAAGVVFGGVPFASGGDCYVFAAALIDNPELRAVLAPVQDRVRLDFLLQPISMSPLDPATDRSPPG